MFIQRTSPFRFASSLLTVLLLILVSVTPLSAQSSQPQPIFTGSATDVTWSADSQSLVFANNPSSVTVKLDKNNWWQYNTTNKALTSSAVWPLQPTLTSLEQQSIASDGKGNSSFAFLSPNHRFAVFVGNPTGIHALLSDRQANQIVDTSGGGIGSFYGPSQFNVLWNASSTAFLIILPTAVDGLVTGFSTNVSQLKFNGDVSGFTLNGQAYDDTQVYGMSDDAMWVILSATKVDLSLQDPYQQQRQLVLFNTANEAISRVIAGIDAKKVIGAGFVPGKTDQFFIVDDAGFVLYDATTGQTTVLNAQINPSFVQQVIFSPNGQWFAAIRPTTAQAAVYVFSTATAPTVTDLQQKVSSCVVDKGLQTSLNAKIDAQSWKAFINEVEAQTGKAITTDCANQLIQIATYLLNNPPLTSTPGPK